MSNQTCIYDTRCIVFWHNYEYAVQPEQYIVPEVHFPGNGAEILYNLKCSNRAKMDNSHLRLPPAQN